MESTLSQQMLGMIFLLGMAGIIAATIMNVQDRKKSFLEMSFFDFVRVPEEIPEIKRSIVLYWVCLTISVASGFALFGGQNISGSEHNQSHFGANVEQGT